MSGIPNSPRALGKFLLENGMNQNTVDALIGQDVDGETFLNLKEEELRTDFPTITFGQRKKILHAISLFTFEVPVNSNLLVPTIEIDPDLGCQFLPQGSSTPECNLDNTLNVSFQESANGNVRTCRSSSSSVAVADETIRKRKPSTSTSSEIPKKRERTSQKNQHLTESVSVLPLLQGSVAGKKIIDFIEENSFLNSSMRRKMLKIVVDPILKKSLYPATAMKVALAKGIVSAFPCLVDSMGGHTIWYNEKTSTGYIQTRINSMRAQVTPSKRKNKPCLMKRVIKPKSKKANPVPAVSPMVDKKDRKAKEAWMAYAAPDKVNKAKISEAMAATYKDRRQWIDSDNPTCTDVIEKYKHLASYNGDMILEEFDRMFPNHKPLLGSFEMSVDGLLSYAEKDKSAVFHESSWVKNATLRALLLLVHILPITKGPIGRKGKTAMIEEQEDAFLKEIGISSEAAVHLKRFPCSALLQVVPVGVDIESYRGVEYPSDDEDWHPMHPFLVWITSDKRKGEIYLKVDNISFHVGAYNDVKTTADPFLKAFDLFVKAHAFNLEYHPYLSNFFNFIESMYKICKSESTSVKTLNAAIRAFNRKNEK